MPHRSSRPRLRVPSGAAVVLALALTACGSDERKGFDPGLSSSGGFGSKDSGSPLPADECSEAAKLVYVVSQENDLYAFRPNTLTFTKVGRFECPTTGLATPNSMAIDRFGTAWVNYSDGSLFRVSTGDASCTGTTFRPNQAGFARFGMAFATDTSDGSAETLYVSGLSQEGNGGEGLGKIDLGAMKLTMIGDYSGSLTGRGAELTGTGDGRLFGFFTTQPATHAAIDKATGATSNNRQLDGVSTGNAWAFSFWGGDFWFYTSDGVGPSKVTVLKTSGDASISVVMEDVGGFKIVGAGVSTCAPTAPPK